MAAPLALVIEDRANVRHLLDAVLDGQGMRVCSAATVDEGLAAARRACPDIVLLDLLLPGSPSDAFVRALRQLPGGDTVPVIVISGLDGASARDSIPDIQEFVAKPFDVHHLLALVRRYLAIRRKATAERAGLLGALDLPPDGAPAAPCP